jgi:hypothetical protein
MRAEAASHHTAAAPAANWRYVETGIATPQRSAMTSARRRKPVGLGEVSDTAPGAVEEVNLPAGGTPHHEAGDRTARAREKEIDRPGCDPLQPFAAQREHDPKLGDALRGDLVVAPNAAT